MLENFLAYFFLAAFLIFVFYLYFKNNSKKTSIAQEKIKYAKETGLYEPVSLHPVVNNELCIGSGACISACPEKDVLGIINNRAVTINASRCVGHGACFHACPVQAISLVMGTEKRGIELPHVSKNFESNIPGIYIAGELGGMGLIKNAVEQGKQAVENISAKLTGNNSDYDLIIIGAGPAGISASLTAQKLGLKYITLEQDSLGGTVFNFPRAKIVMTSPMDLPLFGKIKLSETSKSELLDLWKNVLTKNNISVKEHEKVENIEVKQNSFVVCTNSGQYMTSNVLLSIGRRGSPRKLDVPGEEKEKVFYRLLEPENIHNHNILVVGGGDSAIEAALLLADENNNVTISYRGSAFSRIKPRNLERINLFSGSQKIAILFETYVKEIRDEEVVLTNSRNDEKKLKNDLVYIFAGGELPTAFLEKIGIRITTKFGETILKHGN